MAQPATISDVPAGEIVKHGSQLVTFNLAGTLVAEDIQWQKGFNSVDFADYAADHINGAPGAIKRSAYSATKAVGSMTVQVKSATTVIFPGEFVNIEHVGFLPIKFIVTSVGISYTQNGATKIPIGIAEYMSERQLPSIIALDGDFTQADPLNYLPCGPVRFFNPIPQISTVYGIRQKFAVFRPSWQRLPLNTIGGPFGNTYLVEETELEDTGVADIVTWDRVWVTMPPTVVNRVAAVKTLKYLCKDWNGSTLRDAVVVTQSKQITADAIAEYSVMPFTAVPIPDVSVVKFTTLSIIATGGFPLNLTPGSGFDHNEGYNCIACDIGRWMGAIYYRTSIFGST